MTSTHRVAIAGVALAGVFASSFVGLPKFFETTYDAGGGEPLAVQRAGETAVEHVPAADTRPVVEHVPLPSDVRAIYMTACVLGTPSFRESLIALIKRTEINAVVIDIKDFSGTISFPPEHESLRGAWHAATCGSTDARDFIAKLHDEGIYTIGRITVFQDPYYTGVRPDLAVAKASDGSVWRDHKGLSFIDVSAREYWDYILALATDSYNLGFDELNFDYVRFPSDGPMTDIAFPHTGTMQKPEALERFFAYLHSELSKPERFALYRHENTGRDESVPYTSVDLFGMTTTNTDDLSIGQVQERAAPYFDFIAPMVYPSHYPKTYLGLGNPNDYPYKVVHHAMSSGVRRMTSETTTVEGLTHERIGTSTPPVYRKQAYGPDKFRTWIQDFDYGGDYDAADVRAQIQASYDAGVMSYMIWAPSNIYTEAALVPAAQTALE